MSHARQCCGPCGPGPGGCDLDACVEVVFSGINLVDFFAYCNTDPDCADDPYTIVAAYGINPVLRVPLFLGNGNAKTCRGKVVTRAPVTAPCAVVPGRLFVARGLIVQVGTVCVGGQQYVVDLSLQVGLGTTCPVGMDELITGHLLFDYAGPPIPFGSPVPNQNTTEPEPPGSPPGFCDSLANLVRGVGGSAVVNFASGACDHPTLYDVAERCDNALITILVDGDTAPPGHYGIEYDEESYRLTGRMAAGTPVSVTWTEAVCPPDPGKGPFKLIRCRDTGPATLGPPQGAYFPDPAIGAGNGTASYFLTYTEPVDGDCTVIRCTIIVRYRTTTEPATPGAPVLAHQAGVPCAQEDLARCFLTGCPPGVADRPINPCAQPEPPSWCVEAEGMMAMGGMGGVGATASFATDPAWQARQAAHLSTALGRQAKAANCRGCGDAGTEGLA